MRGHTKKNANRETLSLYLIRTMMGMLMIMMAAVVNG